MAAAHLLHVVWGRTRTAGAEEDDAMCTFHFYSDAAVWPDAAPLNYETAETVLDQWWNSLKSSYLPYVTLKEYRWYREDDLEPPWGPPARVTGKNLPGTVNIAQPQLPPQVALSVTEWTDLEERQAGRTVRHWGRFYLPAPSTAESDADGTVVAAFQDKVLAATDTMYAGMTAAGLRPAVPITGWGGTSIPDSGWAAVKEVRVDDLWDTIRRRKYETVTRRVKADTFGSPTDPHT
jgi:hypothetical protein